jgi:hypothetical protein
MLVYAYMFALKALTLYVFIFFWHSLVLRGNKKHELWSQA